MVTLPLSTQRIVATLHPAFAARGMHVFLPEIQRVIKRAANDARGASLVPLIRPQDIILEPTPEEFAAVLNSPKVVIDVETTYDRPRRILLCGVSSSQGCAVAPWEEPYISQVSKVLMDDNVTKVGHNFAFDIGAFREAGLEIRGPVFDTIQVGALLWPPPSRKKSSGGKGDIRWLALSSCVLRVLAGVAYWKEPDNPATQSFYKGGWPDVPAHLYEALYCGLDCIYTGLLADCERRLLRVERLEGLYYTIVAPAGSVLCRMEGRGMLIDVKKRDSLRLECIETIEREEEKVQKWAEKFHDKRYMRLQAAISKMEIEGIYMKQVASAVGGGCKDHPEYKGLMKRSKCEGCLVQYQREAPRREQIAEARKKLTPFKTKLRALEKGFNPGSDDHWRWLLFSPHALDLKPSSSTEKTRKPRVRDDDIEKLYKKHPELDILKSRVGIQHARMRFNPATGKGKLAIEPDFDGRVRYTFSQSRTSTGRLASGQDDSDPSKVRESAGGNMQNWADGIRSIFIAPFGKVLLQADWSQVEMRVNAWQARDMALLQAYAEGVDIHSLNGIAIAEALGVEGVTLENVAERTFLFEGEQKPFRFAGKKCGLAWIYGMWDRKMAEVYGLKVAQCKVMREVFFAKWTGLRDYQKEVFARASTDRMLRTEFGRIMRFYNFQWDDYQRAWVISDREVALAFPTQSVVGDMLKAVLPYADVIPDTKLVTTVHDSLVLEVDEEDIEFATEKMLFIMQRPWPQLGKIGAETFSCPCDISVGKNLGKFSEANPEGLKEVG